jgi:hypothetical protein
MCLYYACQTFKIQKIWQQHFVRKREMTLLQAIERVVVFVEIVEELQRTTRTNTDWFLTSDYTKKASPQL